MGRHPRSHKRKTLKAKARSKRRGMKGWTKIKESVVELFKKRNKK